MLSEPRFRGFRSHPQLEGTHAILSPSSYHWINYTPEKMAESLKSREAAARGTSLHALAAHAISERVRFQEDDENLSLAMYVNDAIDFEMKPEQMLVYSVNCYGQADAIGFEEQKMFLRVHDYKSGVSPTSEKQLYVYSALFCLEYQFLPFEMDGELRIYQFDGFRSFEIDRDFLAHVYDMIRMHDQHIEERRAKRGSSWTSR